MSVAARIVSMPARPYAGTAGAPGPVIGDSGQVLTGDAPKGDCGSVVTVARAGGSLTVAAWGMAVAHPGSK